MTVSHLRIQGLYITLRRMIDLMMRYGEKAIKDSGIELWPNPSPERDYEINISFPEFTCLCPRSGYPDFATINILYVPDKKIVELKALKLWLNSFRNMHISHEEAANLIFAELWKNLKPRLLEVTGDFNPRGNVKTAVRVFDVSKRPSKKPIRKKR